MLGHHSPPVLLQPLLKWICLHLGTSLNVDSTPTFFCSSLVYFTAEFPTSSMGICPLPYWRPYLVWYTEGSVRGRLEGYSLYSIYVSDWLVNVEVSLFLEQRSGREVGYSNTLVLSRTHWNSFGERETHGVKGVEILTCPRFLHRRKNPTTLPSYSIRTFTESNTGRASICYQS